MLRPFLSAFWDKATCSLGLSCSPGWPSTTNLLALSLCAGITGMCHHAQLEGSLDHSIFYPSAIPGFINATLRKLSCSSKRERPLPFLEERKMVRVCLRSEGLSISSTHWSSAPAVEISFPLPRRSLWTFPVLLGRKITLFLYTASLFMKLVQWLMVEANL